jgi:hypothetical protein
MFWPVTKLMSTPKFRLNTFSDLWTSLFRLSTSRLRRCHALPEKRKKCTHKPAQLTLLGSIKQRKYSKRITVRCADLQIFNAAVL